VEFRPREKKEKRTDENDVPAEKKAEKKGAWIPEADENIEWAERAETQKAQRQKKTFCLSGGFLRSTNGAKARYPQKQERF
jgi:hypothetical protein